ncbi:uncharacterized protein LOC128551287 [Mercenaria mercenaria]|uniref:uncharacterized protein LOC128551287 n=1 Tax=Mercenaria mercenaria TaxID=6596 RepID=UPI00234F5E13|nr:uncharacterized protein LOC128551287 [Mercenaria mercenaria]
MVASEFNYLLITSLNNDTHINVSNYRSKKSSVHETISRLESYTLKTIEDPQLATVTSSKPVNVVVGSMCTNVPNSHGNCDTMYDSQIPVTFLGKNFIVPPLKPKNGYSIRLYPRTENTTVNVEYYNNTVRRNITFKNMKELLMGTDPTVILSDQPVNVVQYGFTEYGDLGDSFMTSVPAVTHFSNDYVFATPFPDKNFTYRLAITIERSHLDGLLLSGKNVSGLPFVGKWTPSSPFDNYTVFTLEIQPGVHILRHKLLNVKFAALLYGLKEYYGFGHSLGFSFPVENPRTCQNGGSCTRDGKCLCLAGFTGDSCVHSLLLILVSHFSSCF